MGRAALLSVLICFSLACAGLGSSSGASRTPITSSATRLEMSPAELRIRVRALIRPAVGIIEESADRIRAEATDPAMRRRLLVWKVEATTTLMAALLRPDPLLALADAWGYTMQMEGMGERPDMQEMLGDSLPEMVATLEELEGLFRDFASGLPGGFDAERLETTVRAWARENPIEGALFRRPSMDSAAAAALAAAHGKGAFAALGSLEETTQDVMTRMDLYTMYVPRLVRWEALIAVEDLARGVDPKTVLAEFEQFTTAADRIAASFETAPAVVAREREIALEALRSERAGVTDDLRAEREIILEEIEAIAARLLDRSSGPMRGAVREELAELTQQVESMRTRLIDDAGAKLEEVVDHAFYRALQLLLVAAALAAVGLFLHARLTRH